MPYALIVSVSHQVKQIKDHLESEGLLDKQRKITKTKDGYEIPLTSDVVALPAGARLVESMPAEDPSIPDLEVLLKLWGIDISRFPSRWTIYPPMVLFSSGCEAQLTGHPNGFYQSLLSSGVFGRRGLTHIAVNSPLEESDLVRRPHITPIYGDFGKFLTSDNDPTTSDFQSAFWVSCVQNGIYQTWCPYYTMFSRGNIKEKARVLNKFADQAPINNHIVVDMYSGIGYFTFSYAKQKPKRVYCWEINPWSVEAVVRGATKNKFAIKVVLQDEEYVEQDSDFIVVFLEDNLNAPRRLRSLQTVRLLTHINLGLLPDSKLAWEASCELAKLSEKSTVLHVHENVSVDDLDDWCILTARTLNRKVSSRHSVKFLHLETIKTFAPGVYHVCGDFKVQRAQ